jgi:hypothetical protein
VVVAIVPRTAALAYMRVLLCLQGLYLVFLGREVFHFRDLNASILEVLAFIAVYCVLGLGEIVTAILLRRGSPRVMIVAIVTAALWLVPVVIGFTSSLSAIPGWQFPVFLVLLLLTIAGLLLPPVGRHGSGPPAAPGLRGLPDAGQGRGALAPWVAACVRVQVVIEGLPLSFYGWVAVFSAQPGVTSGRIVVIALVLSTAGTGLWAAGIAALALAGHRRRWPLAVLLALEALWALTAVLGAAAGVPPALCCAIGIPPLAVVAGLLLPQARSASGMSSPARIEGPPGGRAPCS